ncbi:hypothetical protein [uncultured Proteiniphilum sp.]|uniref:hypothetical protein n=1 Tax=uncultured Proteiniphilum sp. TaxID=497637 RepID=UPI0026219E10|nr:hypothetical protein [uncultured Proteiniphilum sp.]
MDFVDMLLNRFDGEAELKKTNNALVCFSSLETGKVLSRLATYITQSKLGKSSITLLYFIDKTEEALYSEEMNEYQNRIITDFLSSVNREKITVRLFIKASDDHHADIMKISEEQNCNLVLLGVSNSDFHPGLIKKYSQLKNDPVNSETSILGQFQEREAATLKSINALFSRNTVSTGLFMDSGIMELRKIFIPLLHNADVHIFTYLYQIARKENVKIMVWDAIGIIQSEPKMQKFYQFIVKKSEGRVSLWDNDKKIGCDFIQEQDLILIGTEGWNKLICTPLQWTNSLPSTLIIKEKIN